MTKQTCNSSVKNMNSNYMSMSTGRMGVCSVWCGLCMCLYMVILNTLYWYWLRYKLVFEEETFQYLCHPTAKCGCVNGCTVWRRKELLFACHSLHWQKLNQKIKQITNRWKMKFTDFLLNQFLLFLTVFVDSKELLCVCVFGMEF